MPRLPAQLVRAARLILDRCPAFPVLFLSQASFVDTRAVERLPGACGRRGELRRQAVVLASVAAYAVVAGALVWSRYSKLGHGLWHDEIFTVEHYVDGGPNTIFFGDYLPNNHMLFNLLAWLAQLVSPTEAALRLPSVVPFIAGAALVTAWLDAQVGRVEAVVYLGIVTASPLLLDLSAQARGYGLTFLAMSVLVVAGAESLRDGARWKLVAFCVAGVAGTWTLPIFGVAFAATGLALSVWVRGVIRYLVAAGAAIAVWYAPVATDLVASSDQEFGERLAWHGMLTGPFEHLLMPALVGGYVFGVAGLIGSVALGSACAASPLLRDRARASLLLAGLAATFLVVWVARLYVAQRFVSYLLVPALIVLVTGGVTLVERARARGPVVRVPVTAVAVLAVGLMAYVFWLHASVESRYPREAHREAASFIRTNATGARVAAYMAQPEDLEYYLARSVMQLERPGDVTRVVCDRHRDALVLVVQIYQREQLTGECLQGGRHERFRQYARGGAIDIWILPARDLPA
jgi:hypothetical protein